MEDSFGKIVAIFICVIQMFFIPLHLYRENIGRLEQTYILSEITYNVDNFRNTGMIDEEQYNNMRDKIYGLSGGYNIKFTHCTHTADEENDKIVYFNVMYYEGDIEEELDKVGIYYLDKNDYIKILVEDKKGNVIGCYGGSVKNEAY